VPSVFPCESRFNPPGAHNPLAFYIRSEKVSHKSPGRASGHSSQKRKRADIPSVRRILRHPVPHEPAALPLITKPSCSTPFGIIGIFTAVKAKLLTPRLSAQRLSASLESSLGLPMLIETDRTRCSTPFGIIGIFTQVIARKHACGAGAQRLSASLESSRFKSSYLAAEHSRAQRLSASLESSPLVRSVHVSPSLVLNAFRHHWNLHARTMQGFYPRISAQRLSASLESSLGGGLVPGARQLVLNAFRHHWNLHRP